MYDPSDFLLRDTLMNNGYLADLVEEPMSARLRYLDAATVESPVTFSPEMRLMVLGLLSLLASQAKAGAPRSVWDAANEVALARLGILRSISSERRDPAEASRF